MRVSLIGIFTIYHLQQVPTCRYEANDTGFFYQIFEFAIRELHAWVVDDQM